MTALLLIEEVADTLRVSRMTVYRLVRSGTLPALRVGRNLRVRTEDLAAFLDASEVCLSENTARPAESQTHTAYSEAE